MSEEKLNYALAKHLNGDGQSQNKVAKALAFSHKLAQMGNSDIDTVIRAMDTLEAGYGQEWADVDSFSPEVIQAIVRDRKVSSLFERRSIPRSPFIWPVQGGRPKAYVPAENVNATGQTPAKSSKFGTNKTTFDTEYLQTTIWTSDKLEDDSIATIAPQVQENSLYGLIDGEEDAIINGDNDGTHMDYDTDDSADSGDARLHFKGLRARVNAGAKVDLNGGDILDAIITGAAKMGNYGARKSDCAIITGTTGEALLLKSGKLQTMDKYGQYATILTGEVGRVFNIPVIVSEFVREDVSASGVNTNGGANDFSMMLLVNRRAYAMGVQKEISFEPGREPLFNQDYLIARERFDFQSWYPSTHNPVALIHNIPSIV